ncbi:MAG TPA: prepilin peptidase [Rhizomicrobium sp.]|jgi:prepilin peptidase CpaA
MLTALVVFFPLVFLLALAASWDLASYTIPNFIPVAVLLAFMLFALFSHQNAAFFEAHALATLIGLLAGFVLFALGYIGGGDAKLFASAAAWFGMHDLMTYVLAASLLGGVLTLALLSVRRFPLPAALAGRAWIARLHEPRGGIPYGVALAAGGIAILPYTDLFRTVSG